MKKLTLLNLLLALGMLSSCAMNKSQKVTYRVNSTKVDCEGAGPMKCLEVQKGENIGTNEWKPLYTNIEGFSYEPGYLYTLSVKESKVPNAEVPADGSSIHYKLIKVVEKQQDPLLALHNIYVVKEINGESADLKDTEGKSPTLELFVSEKRISGSDGCNSFTSTIEKLNETEIAFGPIAATRMLCQDMTIPDSFHAALNQVTTYEKTEGYLLLKDGKGQTLLKLKNID